MNFLFVIVPTRSLVFSDAEFPSTYCTSTKSYHQEHQGNYEFHLPLLRLGIDDGGFSLSKSANMHSYSMGFLHRQKVNKNY